MEDVGDPDVGQGCNRRLEATSTAVDPVDVLTQVDDRAALHVQEDLVVGGVVTQQALQLAVELADADDERIRIALDLGELDVDARGSSSVVGGRFISRASSARPSPIVSRMAGCIPTA